MPAPSPPVLVLRKPLGRALRQGHPWVYRDALLAPPRLAPGALVALAETAGAAPFAWGFWDPESPIAFRVLSVVPGPPLSDEADLHTLLEARLSDALDRRLGRLDRTQTNAYRWVHGEADGLPGVHVDVYGPVATVRYDGVGASALYGQVLNLPARLKLTGGGAGIEHTVVRRRRGEPAEALPQTLPQALTVRENGLAFHVDVAHGQKGGLFLDQRENRARLAALASGRRVLNLFGYTGAFSVYAAAAGASHTDTVDIAAPAMAAARENFVMNGLPLDRAGFHAVDAFVFLEAAIAAGTTWDIVITDPPSFAPNEKALPAALAAYRRLHESAARVVAEGGWLAAASCSSHVDRARFLESVHEGVAAAGRDFHREAYAGAGFDHPVLPAFPEGDYLKFALGRITSR